MDNVCLSLPLTSNVRCRCLVWNCATSLYVFCCSAWHWNRGIILIIISSHNPVFSPSVFSSRKMDSEKFRASVSFYPEERDNENHQTHTRRSDNENDIIIQMSRIYSETVVLLHHSTPQPSTELTGPAARQKSHHIPPGQTYLEQSIFPMTQRWLGEIRQLQVSSEQSDIAADFIFRS